MVVEARPPALPYLGGMSDEPDSKETGFPDYFAVPSRVLFMP